MNNTQTSPDTSDSLTQHAMLFIWGLYARQIGLVQALEKVKLRQKTRTHSPQKKVLEFLVAIMAGLPHLKYISRSAHPLDKDLMVAEAWGQESWADYSGVSRTLQQLNAEEVTALIAALESTDQPFIDQEIERSLETMEMLIYDGDLTGRPVSDTSTSYPDAAFGHMGDTVSLGYQSALVSMHSPTFGRIWLSNQLHPGDTVSISEAQALVWAAERRTGRLPKRRTALLASRLAKMEAILKTIHLKFDRSFDIHREAEWSVKDTTTLLREWTHEVKGLTADYERQNRQPTPYCKLSQAKRKMATYSKRLPRCQKHWKWRRAVWLDMKLNI